MIYVYAIKSKVRNYIYVGMTANITDRLHRHNSGYERTTRSNLLLKNLCMLFSY
ncbi:GIY-YIG nuclease family protein [Ignavibacterium sp.]|uniref:GIY-YIG nuclease family protein n=1 Tax=Ignavibacterium sp. TaxID=2651167 RepID=UPI00307D9299